MAMRVLCLGALLAILSTCGCSQRGAGGAAVAAARLPLQATSADSGGEHGGVYRGFDRNDYPGDGEMASLRRLFSFTGYWLTDPPGEDSNSWVGKRALLRGQGWGLLVLANGRLDREILKAQRQGVTPASLGQRDAGVAVNAARQEGFPAKTILFLDQEEGGALLEEQAAYLLGWTGAVSASGYRAGVYASGQPVPAGPGKTITTIDDVRTRVKAGHLQEIAMFDAQDACPPAPGCSLQARPLAKSGEMDLIAWQYAQSPQRREITRSCAATYAADGNCYAPGFPTLFLDLDAASSADPSSGR